MKCQKCYTVYNNLGALLTHFREQACIPKEPPQRITNAKQKNKKRPKVDEVVQNETAAADKLKTRQATITVAHWNVRSINSSIKNDLVLNEIKRLTHKKIDIHSLVETHLQKREYMKGGKCFQTQADKRGGFW